MKPDLRGRGGCGESEGSESEESGMDERIECGMMVEDGDDFGRWGHRKS